MNLQRQWWNLRCILILPFHQIVLVMWFLSDMFIFFVLLQDLNVVLAFFEKAVSNYWKVMMSQHTSEGKFLFSLSM
jgi:hypothetical protein